HHAFYTYRLLETIPELKTINTWGAFHHERLDGSGYPFHLSQRELPAGSQIMAVADVFTAITEDRPYRAGMTRKQAITAMEEMARRSALNAEIVSLLKANYDEVNETRKKAQRTARQEYGEMKKRRKRLVRQ
ncbi:MAG: HD domain-containing phosphohydrolase, partial [Nitrospirota bacterium]